MKYRIREETSKGNSKFYIEKEHKRRFFKDKWFQVTINIYGRYQYFTELKDAEDWIRTKITDNNEKMRLDKLPKYTKIHEV